jgi:hypothetical protein
MSVLHCFEFKFDIASIGTSVGGGGAIQAYALSQNFVFFFRGEGNI